MSAADLDLSPPEVPEPTFFESLLRYGLLLGAVFQLVCILSLIMPFNKSHEQEVSAERSDVKVGDQTKKTKGPVPQTRQKPKKETKKKR